MTHRMRWAQKLALAKMAQWKLIEQGWTFGFCRSKKCAGRCSPKRMTIYLNERHVHKDCDEQVLDTILHEIAHAIAGCEQHHNELWEVIASKVGAYPDRYGLPKDVRAAAKVTKATWTINTIQAPKAGA